MGLLIYKKDLIGAVFGRLTIIQNLGVINRNTKVIGRCECGIVKTYQMSSLKTGLTQSCGCLRNERVFKSQYRTHSLSSHPLYQLWGNIKNRCYSISDKCYKDYGGNGVIVCPEWLNDFMIFYTWAIDKWEDGLQLDKDILYNQKFGTKTGKIYSPEFCCFVTPIKNSRNKSNTILIEYKNETKSLSEWCEIFKLTYGGVASRLKRGWAVERTFETPIIKN